MSKPYYCPEKWKQIHMRPKEIERFMNSRFGKVSENRREWEYGREYDFLNPKPSYVKTVPGRLPINTRLNLVGGDWNTHCLIANSTIYYCHCGFGWTMSFDNKMNLKMRRHLTIPDEEFIYLLESFDTADIEHSIAYIETMISLRDTMDL
jgi:hypothetical protein